MKKFKIWDFPIHLLNYLDSKEKNIQNPFLIFSIQHFLTSRLGCPCRCPTSHFFKVYLSNGQYYCRIEELKYSFFEKSKIYLQLPKETCYHNANKVNLDNLGWLWFTTAEIIKRQDGEEVQFIFINFAIKEEFESITHNCTITDFYGAQRIAIGTFIYPFRISDSGFLFLSLVKVILPLDLLLIFLIG